MGFDKSMSPPVPRRSGFFRELKESSEFLLRFLRNPVECIKSPPDLSWPSIVSIQIASSMVSGAVLGALNESAADFLLGLLLFPLTTLVSSFVFSGFLYYFFSLFRATFLDYRRLHTIVALANLPFFALHAASGYLPPIDLIGFAATSVLIAVGLVERFGLDWRTVSRLVGVIFAVFCLLWMVNLLRTDGDPDDFTHHHRPQSLDRLEQDVRAH